MHNRYNVTMEFEAGRKSEPGTGLLDGEPEFNFLAFFFSVEKSFLSSVYLTFKSKKLVHFY